MKFEVIFVKRHAAKSFQNIKDSMRHTVSIYNGDRVTNYNIHRNGELESIGDEGWVDCTDYIP